MHVSFNVYTSVRLRVNHVRHSVHGTADPSAWYSAGSLYMDPYQPGSGAPIPHHHHHHHHHIPHPHSHHHPHEAPAVIYHHPPTTAAIQRDQVYFNPMDGFIYVNGPAPATAANRKSRDSVRRKDECRQRKMLRSNMHFNHGPVVPLQIPHSFHCHAPPFIASPPLRTSTPPPGPPHAPYYVSDTMHHQQDSAGDTLYSEETDEDYAVLENSRDSERRRKASSVDGDVTTSTSSDTPQHKGGCCRCECHLPTEDEDSDCDVGEQEERASSRRRQQQQRMPRSKSEVAQGRMARTTNGQDASTPSMLQSGRANEDEDCCSADEGENDDGQNHRCYQNVAESEREQNAPQHRANKGDSQHCELKPQLFENSSQRGRFEDDAEEEERLLKKNKKLGRSPTTVACIKKQPQSMTDTKWSGVSGVPGLGVSVPARPLSACEMEWNEADLAKSAPEKKSIFAGLRKKSKKVVNKNEDESSSSSSSSSSSPPSPPGSWHPNSLQHVKVDLPRVSSFPTSNRSPSGRSSRTPSVGSQERSASTSLQKKKSLHLQGNAHRSLSSGKISVSQLHANNSRRVSSPVINSASDTKMAVQAQIHHWQQQQQQRAPLCGVASSPWGAPSMPWEDSVLSPMKRALTHRQSYHWGDQQQMAQPRSTSSCDHQCQHHRPLSRERHIAKKHSLHRRSSSKGPVSLPMRLEDHPGAIPRAPIAAPGRKKERSPSSGTEDGGKRSSHYEKLRHNRPSSQPRRSAFSQLVSDFNDSREIPVNSVRNHRLPSNSHLYKVLHDRDGDYSYAYDCSLSPAFLIRYNEEHPEDESGKEDEENIYEEISEVRKNAAEIAAEEEEEQRKSSGSSANSKSSSNTDSGVHINHRKFSSDTLDMGPKGLQLLDKHRPARFSNSSNESFGVAGNTSSDSSDVSSQRGNSIDDDDDAREVEKHWRNRRRRSKHGSSISAAANEGKSDEEFRELIRRHHARVLDQLRLDDEEAEDGGKASGDDKDSGIQDVNNAKSAAALEESRKLSIRAMKFVGLRVKSAGSIKALSSSTNATATTENNNVLMKRCDSMDQVKSSSLPAEDRKEGSWFSRALGRLSSTKEATSEPKKQPEVGLIDEFDEDPVDINESFTIDRRDHRLQRSKIASRWENLEALEEKNN